MALTGAKPDALSSAPAPQLADDWVYQGTANGDEVGYAVASAGDVDGDGYDDLAIGARGDTTDPLDGSLYREGTVSLFHGGPGGLGALPDWQAGGGQKSADFGAAVAAAGYLNDDPLAAKRYADLVVGAPEYNNGISKAGAAMVYYGSEAGLADVPDWSYVSPQRDANLGNAVAGGGDLDGDGYDDLIVASRWYSDTFAKEGAVLIFYGSAQGLPQPASPDLMITGRQAGALLGSAVAAGGDANGDGYDDVLIGAPQYNGVLVDQGAVFLHLGGPGGLSPTPAWAAYGPQEGSWLGGAVAWAGDVNGDGYDDLAAGAPGDALRVPYGTVYVYYGAAGGPGLHPGAVMTVAQPGSCFGTALAGARDMDGDGYDDLLAGAYRLAYAVAPQNAEGAALLYFGSRTGIASAPGWVRWGDKANATYGFAVGSAGLPDGTGSPAITVGAPYYKLDDKTPLGRAFVHFGPLEPRYYLWLPLLKYQGAP